MLHQEQRRKQQILIATVREAKVQGHPNEKETISGARGANIDGMRIHSVRLPGLDCPPTGIVWKCREH